MTAQESGDGTKDYAALAVSLIAVATVAAVGSRASANASAQYGRLQQPPWAPPVWFFGPVWTALYVLMAAAAWLVWRTGPLKVTHTALTVYGIQLILNMAWPPLFFTFGWRGWAVVEIAVLWGFIASTVVLFWRRDQWAAALLLPYLTWTSFMAVLNFSVWQLNR